MSAIKTANLYHSLSLHFNDEKYDAIKYNFKIKARKSMSEGHFYIFDKLYKKYKNNILAFFVANFIVNEKLWINDLLSETCHEIYIKFIKKYESLSYVFDHDLSNLLENRDMKKVLTIEENYPIIIVEQWRGNFELESLLILNHYLRFLGRFNNHYKNDIIWEPYFLKCKKYYRFLNFDKIKCKEIIKSYL